MIARLIQDCETALEEEEFVTACSTEGATLPMIYFEVRELPDEETPTSAYLNWTAQRISEIQRSAESQRRRKTEPVSVVLPESKYNGPPGAQGLLRCVTNEHCVSKNPVRAGDGEERRVSELFIEYTYLFKKFNKNRVSRVSYMFFFYPLYHIHL